MTWQRPTMRDLIGQAVTDMDRVPDADARLPVSNLNALAIVLAGVANGLHGAIELAVAHFIWHRAKGEMLRDWASMVDVTPVPGGAAFGGAEISGKVGNPVPVGTRLQRADNWLYETTADAVIGSTGKVVVPVEALDTGVKGNAVAGTKLTLVKSIPDIQAAAVVSAEGIAGGAEPESDDSLLDRFLAYWRVDEDDVDGLGPYARLARQVPGVTRAWEYEHEMGLGTVTVRFVMDGKPDTPIPTALEIAEVEAHLQARRPPGMPGLYAVAPIGVPRAMTVAIDPDTAEIRTAVQAEYDDFIRREAVPGGPIALSRASEAISSAAGEYRHKINAPADDWTHAANELALPAPLIFEAY